MVSEKLKTQNTVPAVIYDATVVEGRGKLPCEFQGRADVVAMDRRVEDQEAAADSRKGSIVGTGNHGHQWGIRICERTLWKIPRKRAGVA